LQATNYPKEGAWPVSDAVLEFWDPLPISETAEGKNLKFGIWLDYIRYKLAGQFATRECYESVTQKGFSQFY